MRITRYAAMAAATGLLLAACSSEAGSQAKETAGETAAVETDVNFDAGTTMARLNEAGKITVGTKIDQPGFGLMNPQTNVPEGFDVEIAKLIAAKLGIDADKKVVDFAGPYYEAGQDIMVAKGNPEKIEGPEDLAGKKVCSVEGSTPAQNIRDKYPEAQLITYD